MNTTTPLFTSVNYYAGSGQDDFSVNNKLTLNLGLRYECETGISEVNNHSVVGFHGAATERLKAFRAAALNLFNTPQFPNPNTSFVRSAFGNYFNSG